LIAASSTLHAGERALPTAAQRAVTIFTIGFTKKNAERFFGLLGDARIEQLVDTRVFPNTQLSGFAKGVDLPYFLRRLVGADYVHRLDFAPTEALLRAYRDDAFGWDEYERRYKTLLADRKIERSVAPSFFEKRTALLCSEDSAKRCHRRLLVEYLAAHWGEIERIDL
jgi:uncharacterized protein (DUF488 family)